MSIVVDARKLACPEPVILTLKALQKDGEVTTIVDNPTARENVSKLSESQGCRLSVEEKGGDTYLHLSKSKTAPAPAADQPPPASGPLVLFIAGDIIGRGSEDLGGILMRSFMHTLGETKPRPHKIIFINSGVKLVAKSSPVLGDLQYLAKEGVAIEACGTCLQYYNLMTEVAVGRVSNMYDIAASLLQAGKVVAV